MADGRGALSTVAMKKATTWNTSVKAVALDGLRIERSSPSGGKEIISDKTLSGKTAGNAPIIGQEVTRLTWDLPWRYGGNCDLLLAAIMGAAAAPTEVEATYEYTHALTIEERLGDFFSLIELKGDIAAWEYKTAKLARLTMELTGRGHGTMSAEFICAGLITDDSGTNKKATMADVTVPAPLNPVYIGEARVWMNAAGGDALDADDAIKPNLIRIVFDRKLSEDWVADQGTGKVVGNPSEEEDIEVTIEIGLPEYVATTYHDAVNAGTEYKMTILLSGPELPTAASEQEYEYEFDFPKLVGIERPDNALDGPGRITDSITFKCLQPTAAPTGMGTTQPFDCLVRNQSNANILA